MRLIREDDLPADLEAGLRSSGPQVAMTGAEELSRQLAVEVIRTSRRPLTRVAKRRLVVLGVAAMIAVPGVAAAAGAFNAETGTYGLPGKTENDTSEYIDMCAPDYGTFIRTLEPTRALPMGTSWDHIAQVMADRASSDPACRPGGRGSEDQTTGIKANFLLMGNCAWEKDFVGAHATGDGSEQARASAAIVLAYNDVQTLGGWADTNWIGRRDAAAKGDFPSIDADYQANCLDAGATGTSAAGPTTR